MKVSVGDIVYCKNNVCRRKNLKNSEKFKIGKPYEVLGVFNKEFNGKYYKYVLVAGEYFLENIFEYYFGGIKDVRVNKLKKLNT